MQVLIVEDEDSFARTYLSVLSAHCSKIGLKLDLVDHAKSVEKAKDFLDKKNYNLLLLDNDIFLFDEEEVPSPEGYTEVLPYARKKNPNIIVISVSSHEIGSHKIDFRINKGKVEKELPLILDIIKERL